MISAENSISEPPNLKIFWGRIPPYPPTRLVLSALRCLPVGKKPSYGPGNLFIFFEFVQYVPSFVFVVLFTLSSNVLSRYSYPSLSLVAALTVWILPDKFRASSLWIWLISLFRVGIINIRPMPCYRRASNFKNQKSSARKWIQYWIHNALLQFASRLFICGQYQT